MATADALGSPTATALMLTVGGLGADAGAVYQPVEVIVPQAAPEHPVPEIDHVTAVLVDPDTEAENCCDAPVATCTDAGDTLTVTDCADRITTLALAHLEESADEVAVIVAIEGVGMVAGAVYKPAEEMDPQDPATQPVPETLHVTLWLAVPVTEAINCNEPFTATFAELGVTETAICADWPRFTVA